MVVATESAVGITVLGVRAFTISTGDVPLDDSLVTGRRQNHVSALVSGGDAGNPVAMAFQHSSEGQSIAHFAFVVQGCRWQKRK